MPDTVASPPSSSPLLRVENLGLSFPQAGRAKGDRLHAVRGVSLSIYENQTLAVVGESGSGKSVTAMSALRLIPTPPGRYESGHMWWRDEGGRESDLLGLDEKELRAIRGNQIAMIFQEPMTSLNPVYTIGEQIIEAIRLHRTVTQAEAVAIAAESLDSVGIGDATSRLKEYPHQLSGGMRQRVMIAMALACQPKLLLADEPTTALDVTIQAQILELLNRLKDERGMAVLLITHDLGVVAETADVVAVMFAGRVVEYADVNTLFHRPLHPYTRGLLKSMPRLGVFSESGRLPTVADGATIPEDFPAGFKAHPHAYGEDAHAAYGDARLKLHEVEKKHWVLCEAENAGRKVTEPDLDFRRLMSAGGV